MKNIFTSFLLLASLATFAQSDVYLQFNHLWNDAPFQLDQELMTNGGQSVKVDRLEFYLSQFSIQHDGGQITTVDNTWLLVRPAENESFYLGNYDITTVEAITFSCGVEEAFNHLDPATYPMDHPLAPQNPSMHWGWASGYRFIAFEGTAGAAFSQIWEIHALGDAHYIEQSIATGAEEISGDLYIGLDGNYANLLGSINVSNGMIEHSETGQTINAVFNNMQNAVFSASDGTVGIAQENQTLKSKVFPNPAQDRLQVQSEFKIEAVKVFNAQGVLVLHQEMLQSQNVGLELDGFSPGFYSLCIIGEHTQEKLTFIVK